MGISLSSTARDTGFRIVKLRSPAARIGEGRTVMVFKSNTPKGTIPNTLISYAPKADWHSRHKYL